MRPPRACHAFTALELLVVITLISLLLTVLMPAFAATRQQARQVQGQSHLRQIGLAAHAYAGDYDGFSIPSDLDPGHTNLAWQAYLWAHYLNRNSVILTDPQLTEQAHYNPATSGPPYDQLTHSAYVMNIVRPMSSREGWGSDVTSMTTDQKRRSSGWTGIPANTRSGSSNVPVRFEQCRPSQAIYIVDHRVSWSTPGLIANGMVAGIQRWLQTDHGDTSLGASSIRRRKVGLHQSNDGFNALYGDGHTNQHAHRELGPDAWVARVR